MNKLPAHADEWRPLFKADWTRFIFLHYALPPDELAPFTPLELDCRDGRAFVSLVFFRLDKMRPARVIPDAWGRALCRLASDNWFLNVRTYVRGPAGSGIQFLIEWMDNPFSVHLGPWLYGLPYRKGKFDCQSDTEKSGASLRVVDPKTKEAFHVVLSGDGEKSEKIRPHSLAEFLVEKYTAYTHHRGVSRFFHIEHPAWSVAPRRVLTVNDQLIRRNCPWFKHAEMISAHSSAGFQDVTMSAPYRLREEISPRRLTSVTQPG